MILLRKWWAPIRARLIDDAGRWWRFWSMRLAILGALLESFARWFPDQVRDAWTWLPDDMRALLPGWLTRSVPLALFVAVIVARLVPQKLSDRASAAGEHADG